MDPTSRSERIERLTTIIQEAFAYLYIGLVGMLVGYSIGLLIRWRLGC